MQHAVTTKLGDRSVVESVVTAVAEAEDVPPSQLSTAIYEAVDPDALERLFAARTSTSDFEGRLVFSYHGYEVTVRGEGEGEVIVEGR